ncbi:S1 family peptidase [Natronolimnobius baerhuensis]|nr:serine protease [Natronolimnobius baerhuensis]
MAGLAGCTSQREPTSDAINQEQKTRIEELEALVKSKDKQIEELHREDSISEFSTDIIERAETMARDARNATVTVGGEGGSGGTGWILDANKGYVVTNSHVVIDNNSFSIQTFDGDSSSATRIGYYEDMIPDVALLQMDLEGIQELPIGDRSNLTKDDPLVTIGHPGTIGNWIMTLGRHKEYDEVFDTLYSTVPTSRGNSGGPLLTLEGNVVGVVSGSRLANDSEDDFSKSDVLYTQLPERDKLTTSAPVETLLESVDEWT